MGWPNGAAVFCLIFAGAGLAIVGVSDDNGDPISPVGFPQAGKEVGKMGGKTEIML